MKRFLLFTLPVIAAAFVIYSCSTPISLSSWKNPQANGTISKILVMAVYDKMNAIQATETQFTTYFGSQGLKSMKSLDVMNPFQQYTKEQIQKKLDSLGCDGLLLVTYKSKDVNVDYQQGFYGGYRGYWGGGGSLYIDNTYNFRAMLYQASNGTLLWSGDLGVTNPDDANSAAQQCAAKIYTDWVAKSLLKNPPPPPTK